MGQLIINDKLRARSSEDKSEKRDHLIRTAVSLFESNEYSEITMAMIAKKSKTAKGTVYLYFRTKEELFLKVLLIELQKWNQYLDQKLNGKKRTKEQFIEIFLQSFDQHTFLPRLLAILHTVLEKNIEEEVAFGFKKELKDIIISLAQKINLNFGSTIEDSCTAVLQVYTNVIGFWQLTHFSKNIQTVLENKELAIFKLDFKTELKKVLYKLL